MCIIFMLIILYLYNNLIRKKLIYLWHSLITNSETFFCISSIFLKRLFNGTKCFIVIKGLEEFLISVDSK